MEFSRPDTGVDSLSLLQGIFPTQGLKPGLPHCRWILYQLSHKGSPRILEWVASPSPADLPNPGIEPGSPALQADSSTELPGKPSQFYLYIYRERKKMKVLVAQLCLTLCDPMNCSPPSSSVHGILQAKILDWVAFYFFRASS